MTVMDYLATLPRDEAMYAARFAHWYESAGHARAVTEAESSRRGIRATRAQKIRTVVVGIVAAPFSDDQQRATWRDRAPYVKKGAR